MRMKIYVLLFVLLILTVGQIVTFAGTTGKIAGRVTDSETGEPLPFVNVLIDGTNMGAATDIDGYYAILNIPPGNYTLRVQYVGYQTIIVEGVLVKVDFTTERDFQLTSSAVELGELVVTAERPLVIKDMTSSLSSVTADQIENLPVNSIQDVLRLSAGVVEDAGRLSIRGGRTSEVAYWVNGISTTDVYNGSVGLTVENAAVQELQVISGTFNAEYGQAMSGVVNIITKQGGKNYTGQIKVYAGDYVSSGDEFNFYQSVVTEADPVTGLTRIVSSEVEKPLEKYNPIYNGEFSLSGPIPFTGDNITFFATGRYLYDKGYFYGSDWFRPNGSPGSNSEVALNPFERYSAQGKLSYQISSAIRLSYDLFWNKSKRERNFFAGYPGGTFYGAFGSHGFKYNPYGIPKNFNDAYTHLVTINHVVSPSTFYELRLSSYQNKIKQYVYESPLQGVNYIQQVDSIGAVTYQVDPNGPDGYIEPNAAGGFDAPASNSFLNRGMDMNHTDRKTSYLTGKLDITSQVNNANQVKLGFEARLHELELHNFRIIPKLDANGSVITPFQPSIPQVGNINREDYLKKPRELSAYIQDKIEFDKIILNVGLRWDYFDANSVVPADPRDPSIYVPLGAKNKFDVNGDGKIDQLDNQSDPSAVERRRSYWYKKVDPKTFFSPRLGIAFPITDRGVIHFSYGHFFQIPEFQYLYVNSEFKITESSGNVLMGNPDLEPQKTAMYEIGLQQQLTDNIGVDVTLFYRDVRDWVGTSPLITTYKADVEYSMYENKDYENVKGVTLKVEKRFSDNYSFRADYTFQSAEGTYSNPNDAFNDIQNNRAPVLQLLPTNWDQKHTVNAQLIYQISDWTFSLIGRYWSGQPYTPSFPVGETATETRGQLNNSARLPSQRGLDLTISKLFLLSGLRVELFLNVYNLLDLRDNTNVYTDTGSADYTTTIDPSSLNYNSYNPNRISTVEDFVLQPSWYTGPRQVQLGLILGF
jgi:hypothetical protein